ncbi:hypothetical protein, partial [Candidatus Hakubella thermalkaliphila]|uniref:hypothetical protein n=1 Tax=Candidatus Hakubella thermalkaliphila TaxID=2754717 RepID=UPI001C612942
QEVTYNVRYSKRALSEPMFIMKYCSSLTHFFKPMECVQKGKGPRKEVGSKTGQPAKEVSSKAEQAANEMGSKRNSLQRK